MALQDLLKLSSIDKQPLSQNRIEKIIPVLRKYVAFWREYPDLFIDFLQDGGDPTVKKKFKFYAY